MPRCSSKAVLSGIVALVVVSLTLVAPAGARDTAPTAVPPAPAQEAAPPPVRIEPVQPAPGAAVVAPAPPPAETTVRAPAGPTTVDAPAAARPDVPAAPAPAPDAPARDPNSPLKQTGEVLKDLAKGDVKALRRGPLLIHGNYCGIGNRPGTAPTDALDAACMRHDACTHTGKLPSCPCDNRLREEALAIARDARTPPNIQALATSMAASMVILICK